MAEDKKIPVTILTGFLGSGKTTFVNYLLKANHGKKLAIVENEFGEVGIDDGLVVQSEETVIDMMNGCICCTVRDDLITALKNLVETRKGKFDAILIETTGLADPAPVAQTFFVDEDMKRLFELDSIITFIDCKHTPAHLAEVKPDGVENEAVEQVAFADILVLNKTDLVNKEEMDALKKQLKGINSSAKMLETSFSKLPVDEVLDIKAFNLAKTVEMDDGFLDTDAEHMHDKSVSSVGVCIEGEFMPDKFNDWLSNLLRDKGADIYRSKGIIALVGTSERYVFQGVHMMLRMVGSHSKEDGAINLADWGPDEKKMNKLCFIGKNLDRKEITDGLQACIFNGKFPEPGPKPTTSLRFSVGEKVMINVGEWEPAKVVAHWYREALWESGRYVPYQLELADGTLAWAPRDKDAFVRPFKMQKTK